MAALGDRMKQCRGGRVRTGRRAVAPDDGDVAHAGDPRLVVCDEPTSALDVSVQATICHGRRGRRRGRIARGQLRLGSFELFLSPVEKPRKDQRYEAVVDRSSVESASAILRCSSRSATGSLVSLSPYWS